MTGTLTVSGAIAATAQNFRFFNASVALTFGPTFYTDICAKFNGSIWVTNWIASSSDVRIKTNIKDIEDDSALQKILQIQPKIYEYIDKVERGNNIVYGFIAQQIKEVIPEAVGIEKCVIPNIYKVCNYITNAEDSQTFITIPNGLIEKLKINDEIDIVIKNDNKKTFNIIDIIDDKIKINEVLDKNETECFVYGTEVNDFHTLDKTYIFTLNVCATQELYRLIQELREDNNIQKQQIIDLQNQINIIKSQ